MLAKAAVLGVTVALIFAVPVSRPAQAGAMETYVVLYNAQAVPSDAASAVSQAGGTFVQAYDAIGVVIARSQNTGFADSLRADNRIQSVTSTSGLGTKLRDDLNAADAADATDAVAVSSAQGTGGVRALQWDMAQIHVPEAHNVTGGSRNVVVGDIDTGLDPTHPNLAPNVDFADSVSCLTGVPDQTVAAWTDHNGHGTHTAGTIAAAALPGNNSGFVGIAPNVRIAAIKAGTDDGFFFPESVVCAFMWAGSHHLNVTNNSYFADPFYFNCRNDPVQRAILQAEGRAIRFAIRQGVTNVAAAGNFSDDLANPTQDVISPDFPPGAAVTRKVNDDCVVIPVQIPGVIGVSAVGNLQLKSFYSNYGEDVVKLAAPGGDSILQKTAAAPNGRVLSTFPAALIGSCLRPVFDGPATYCYLQGTSMASPHVSGVAALVASVGRSEGRSEPKQVAATLTSTADPIACPTAAVLALYTPFPSASNGAPQRCQGESDDNSWYGHGQINALNAVLDAIFSPDDR